MSAISRLKERLIALLRWSERYTKTDMVYLASGTFWSNFSSGTVMVLAFVTSLFFAHFLTKDQYGIYQYVLAIAGLVSALTLTGMNSAVTRAVARGHEGELRHSVRFQLLAGIIPFMAGLGIAFWYLTHGNKELAVAFAWVAVFLPLSSAFNTWVAYLGGKKMFKVGSYYGLFNNIMAYVPILVVLLFVHNFLWVVCVNYFFAFISGLLIYRHMVRRYPPNDERDPETIPYGTHLSLMSILGTALGQLDSFLVFHFIGPTELAIYSFATLIPERLAGMLKFIPNIAFMKLAEKSEDEVRRNIVRKLLVLMGLVGICAACYALLAPIVFHIFFPQYSASIPLTQLYALSFFSLAPLYVQTALMAQRKTRQLYILNFVAPLIRASLMVVLMFYFGIYGLLWAQVLNNFVSLGFQLGFLWRRPAIQEV